MENQIIHKYINSDKNDNISLTCDNFIKLSDNIIDLNPVPLYIKTIDDNIIINQELNNIADQITDDRYIYIGKNQDPNKNSTVFTSQNAYVPNNNILSLNNDKIEMLKHKIMIGIQELTSLHYKNREYTVNITNSWMQKYKSGSFLSPHNHLSSNTKSNDCHYYSVAYYIDDGDPDLTQTYSGCISFITNKNLFHIRPKPGMLLIWEASLVHLVNPFFSKSNKERFMLSCNLTVNIKN